MKQPENMTLLELQSAVHKLQHQVTSMRNCENCSNNHYSSEQPNPLCNTCNINTLNHWKGGT